MSYWTYYLFFVLLSYGLNNPLLLVGVLLFLALRRFIPSPGALFGALGRVGRLRALVETNAANVTARRDLAMTYLELLRPKRALQLLDEARARQPDSAELLYLTGLARHRAGQHEAALEPLVQAVDVDARVRFGEPYVVAGDALGALGRWQEAEDAYERFLETNTSSIDGHVKLARARARLGRRDEARRTLREGLDTWRQIPPSLRRRQLGAWLRAQRARLTIAREPVAIVVALILLASVSALGAQLAPSIVGSFRRTGADRSRFERLDARFAVGTSQLRTRWSLEALRAGDRSTMRKMSVGDFACRIWALYGPPDPVDDGFSYVFRDHRTGLVFTAYSAGTGPSYGGCLVDVGRSARIVGAAERLAPVVDAFDALIDRTAPVDCVVHYDSDEGPLQSGSHGGVPFDQRVDEPPGE